MADYDRDAVDASMDNVRDEYDNPLADEVIDAMDVHHLIDRCEGRGGGLRVSKPDTDSDGPLEAYVWRMCRFHSGDDPCIPVMAESDLSEWMDDNGWVTRWYTDRTDADDDNADMIKDIINDYVVTIILLCLGKNPKGGAERWNRAIHG